MPFLVTLAEGLGIDLVMDGVRYAANERALSAIETLAGALDDLREAGVGTATRDTAEQTREKLPTLREKLIAVDHAIATVEEALELRDKVASEIAAVAAQRADAEEAPVCGQEWGEKFGDEPLELFSCTLPAGHLGEHWSAPPVTLGEL